MGSGVCRLRHLRYQVQLVYELDERGATSPLKRGRELVAELLAQRTASSSEEDDESVSSIVALAPYGSTPPPPHPVKRRSRWEGPLLLQ